MRIQSSASPPDGGVTAYQRSVRRANLGAVLSDVERHGRTSRARIAASTGLNKTTVSSLVSELVDMRLLEETGAGEPTGLVGRPSQTLRLGAHGVASIGLEVNIDFLSVRATDLTGGVRYERQVTADNRGTDAAPVLSRLAGLAREAIAAIGAEGLTPIGMTVATPGLVDIARGVLVRAPDLGWSRTPVASLLADLLGAPDYPIRIDNEANLGALAELWAGAGRPLHDFLYVSAEVGVGAGVISGGALLRGASGFAGELGHVTVDPAGPRCTCGARGCLAMFAGEDVLLGLAGLEGSPPGAVRLAATALAERVRQGDARTERALGEVGFWLGVALAGAINLLNPQAVVLGGYLGALAPWLEPPISAQLEERVLAADCGPCSILASELGEDAAVQGAAALALKDLIADPLSVGPLVAAAAR